MPERLLTLAQEVPEEGVVCDVGSDHGLLPLFLLRRSPALFAVVTDIRPLPLERARAALREGGVESRAEFVLADGIASLANWAIDCFVIAGMSGETIARILKEGQGILRAGQRFCLQPMSHEDLLRAHLWQNGFDITKECVVRENGKLFLLLFAVYTGKPADISDPVLTALGTFLPGDPGEWGKAYYEAKRKRLSDVVEKRRKAGRDVTEQEKILTRLDAILEEMP